MDPKIKSHSLHRLCIYRQDIICSPLWYCSHDYLYPSVPFYLCNHCWCFQVGSSQQSVALTQLVGRHCIDLVTNLARNRHAVEAASVPVIHVLSLFIRLFIMIIGFKVHKQCAFIRGRRQEFLHGEEMASEGKGTGEQPPSQLGGEDGPEQLAKFVSCFYIIDP